MNSVIEGRKEHTQVQFTRLVYDRQHVEGAAFYDCSFVGCSFRETVFKDCKFTQCSFEGCNLSLANVEGSAFSGVSFEDCQLLGVNWTLADLPQKPLHKPFDFHKCALNYSVFMGLNLEGVEIHKCIARGVDFSDANLTAANCQHTDFAESRFANTDLTQADFCHAWDYRIDATLNTLKKTKFTLPEAMSLLYSLDIELVV